MEAFGRALVRETAALSRRPHLVWPQLYNRLQWSGDPAVRATLEPELRRRRAPGAPAWARLEAPYRESETLVRTLVGHDGPVKDCAWSPDGGTIASAGVDGTVRVWDAVTGREVTLLDAHEGMALRCAFGPDGGWIASAGTDRANERTRLALWDVRTARERAALGERPGRMTAWALRADGGRIVTADPDGTLVLWDPRAGRAVAEMEGHDDEVAACAFTPDGRSIVSGGKDGRLLLWDAETGAALGALHEPFVLPGWFRSRTLAPTRFTACAFSPDGTRFLTGEGLRAKIRDVETGEEVVALDGREWLEGCAFSPDGRWVLGVHDDRLTLWEVRSGRRVAAFEGHAGPVWAAAFDPNGGRIASAGSDGTVRLWDARSIGEESALRAERTRERVVCAYSPDGLWIAAGSEDQRDPLAILDAATGETVAELAGHWVSAVAFGPDAARIATGAWNGTLRVWDAAAAAAVTEIRGDGEAVATVAWSPDGARVLGGAGHALSLWDADTGKRAGRLKGHTDWIRACAFSPDGGRIASTGTSGEVRLWDARALRPVAVLQGSVGWEGEALAFSPDGSRIVSAHGDGALLLWDAATGHQRAVLAGGPAGRRTDGLVACAFGPDGRWIATASRGGEVVVRDAESGAERAAIVLPAALHGLALHPHAPRLAVGDGGGSVHRVELVGLPMGPVLVTAIETEEGASIRCPACWRSLPPVAMDAELRCPGERCGLLLRANPFRVDSRGAPAGLLRRLVGRLAG